MWDKFSRLTKHPFACCLSLSPPPLQLTVSLILTPHSPTLSLTQYEQFTVTFALVDFFKTQCESTSHTCQSCSPGPPAEKSGRGSRLNRPSCPPDDPIGQGTEMNGVKLLVCPHVAHSVLWALKTKYWSIYRTVCLKTKHWSIYRSVCLKTKHWSIYRSVCLKTKHWSIYRSVCLIYMARESKDSAWGRSKP